MKIIRKDTMPNGVYIQLEDWGESGLTIGAYPIAINSSKHGWVLQNHPFRLHIQANPHANYTNADVTADYKSLINGQKSLEDLADHFWNGDKDKWYLGMFKPGTDEWFYGFHHYGINATF